MMFPPFVNILFFFVPFIALYFWLANEKKVPMYMLIGAVFIILLGVFFIRNDFLTETGTNSTVVGNTTTTLTTFAPVSMGITHNTFGVSLLLLGLFFVLITVLEQWGLVKA
jgi:hypothetical protein